MTTPTSEPTPPTSDPTPLAVTTPAPAAEVPAGPKRHELKDVPWSQVVMSAFGIICWILLYAAGLLMESVEERILLAPHTMEKQLGPNGKDLVVDVIKQAKEAEQAAVPGGPKPNDAKSEPGKDPKNSTAAVPSDEKGKEPKAVTAADKVDPKSAPLLATRRPVSRPAAFFYSVLVYTPTNMALLTLFAGLLGGCVSNIKYSMMTKEERANLKPHEDAILSENPLSATMRGFVIYLCMVAGLYVVLDDPFKDSTPGQYARLAGSMSLVAFIVGFDPTRIKAWLRMADSKSASESSNTQTGSTAKT